MKNNLKLTHPVRKLQCLNMLCLFVVPIKPMMLSTGVEKLNDDCRRIHLRRSDKWEAAKDVLLVVKRIKNLQEFERSPRQYTERSLEY